MNLTQNPTEQELRDMIAQCDDNAGSHLIWVGWDGTVNIQTMTQKLYDERWIEQNEDRIKFRLEIIQQGNGYVGREASLDDRFMNDLFNGLVGSWNKNKRGVVDDYLFN